MPRPIPRPSRVIRFLLLTAMLAVLAACGRGGSDEGGDGGGGGNGGAAATLIKHGTHEATSHRMIRMLVQARDENGDPLTGLSYAAGDFGMTDNGRALPNESFVDQIPPERYPFRVRTVVMLDITTGNYLIDNLATVQSQLRDFFDAANLLDQQRISVWAFANGEARLIGASHHADSLDAAVDTLSTAFDTNHGIEGASTDLFGAALKGLGQWSDTLDPAGVTLGNLILITEGDDVAANHTLDEVLNQRGARRVYTVGLGANPNAAVLEDLGNGGYFPVSQAGDLAATLGTIQGRIAERVGSFYHFYYGTTYTGDANRTWRVSLATEGGDAVGHTYNPGTWEPTRDSVMLFSRPRGLLSDEAVGPDGGFLAAGANGAGYTLDDPNRVGMAPGGSLELTLTTHWLASASQFGYTGNSAFSVATQPATGDANRHVYRLSAPGSGGEEQWTFTDSGPDTAISDSVWLCATAIAVDDGTTTHADGSGLTVTQGTSPSLSLANFDCPTMAGNLSGEIRWQVADAAIADLGSPGAAEVTAEHDGSIALNAKNPGTTLLRVEFTDAGLEGIFPIQVP